jgi:formiminoglutamase
VTAPEPPRYAAPDVPAPCGTADDPRIGQLLGRALGDGDMPRAVIVGFPTDEGVRRNGGRPGAAEGPAAIREMLHRLTPGADDTGDAVALLERTRDLGDLVVSGDLRHDQELLGIAVTPYLAEGAFVVVLGGGHETAYGHFLGYPEAGHAVTIVNWDAHLDVRDLKAGRGHSGSPFRQALEHASGACRGYVVAGVQPQATARAHLDYVHGRGGRVLWASELSPAAIDALYAAVRGPAMISFDLDAVDQSHAPGVSAPATGGMSADLWLRAARGAGRCPSAMSMDVVELNPKLDRDGQTARLAALTVWQVLRGVAERGR